MNATDLAYTPATDLIARIRSKALSPVEVTRAVLERIEQTNPKINAFVTVTGDTALVAARAAESAVMKGERLGPLHGVPVSIKDLALVKDVPAKFGSAVFEQRIGEVDAPFVRRLREAGAILTGKTSTPEFGWKALSDSPLTGITRNPWNTAMTSGGSSAGAGAAAAAGLGPLHQGSDGAGSVRVPSAFCGIYGLKPTFGRVPMWPVSNTDSASHVGPMTRTVADAALMLAVMAGPDDWDRQSLDAPPADYVGRLRDGVKGLRVGWSLDLGCCRVDPEIGQVARRAAEAFQELGCAVEDAKVSLPDTREMIHLMWNAHYAGNYAPFLEKFRARMDPGLVAALEDGRRYTAEAYVEISATRSTSPASPPRRCPRASPPPACRWGCRSSAGGSPISRCCRPPPRSRRRGRGWRSGRRSAERRSIRMMPLAEVPGVR